MFLIFLQKSLFWYNNMRYFDKIILLFVIYGFVLCKRCFIVEKNISGCIFGRVAVFQFLLLQSCKNSAFHLNKILRIFGFNVLLWNMKPSICSRLEAGSLSTQKGTWKGFIKLPVNFNKILNMFGINFFWVLWKFQVASCTRLEVGIIILIFNTLHFADDQIVTAKYKSDMDRNVKSHGGEKPSNWRLEEQNVSVCVCLVFIFFPRRPNGTNVDWYCSPISQKAKLNFASKTDC